MQHSIAAILKLRFTCSSYDRALYVYSHMHILHTNVSLHMHTLTPVSLVVSVNKIIEGTNMHYSWQLPPFQDDNVTFSLSPLTSNTFPPFTAVVLELYDQEPGEEYTSIATNSHIEESLLLFSNCYTCRSAMLTTIGVN